MISHSRIPPFARRGARDAHGLIAVNEETAHDARLVERFKGGDGAAFVEIVGRYRLKMHAVGLRVLRNHADAEEIAQDTFIRAHRGLALFRGDSSLATWLQHIAFNLSRNRYWYFRRRHRQDSSSFDAASEGVNGVPLADLLADTAPDPEREASRHEFVAGIEGCMERLSPNHRDILLLRNVSERSYEEIATALGISVGTVKSRIARARMTLRGLLTERQADAQDMSGALLSYRRFDTP